MHLEDHPAVDKTFRAAVGSRTLSACRYNSGATSAVHAPIPLRNLFPEHESSQEIF